MMKTKNHEVSIELMSVFFYFRYRFLKVRRKIRFNYELNTNIFQI